MPPSLLRKNRMANAREIKGRIESVKNTQKITGAMYLISSTKLRKAKLALDNTRPYFDRQETVIKRVFQTRPDVDSIYFYPKEGRHPAETYAYLVITADKGLAGAYNHNVIKRAEEEMRRHKKVRLFVVGEFGRQYFTKHKIPIAQSFLYTAQNPTFDRAREIAGVLLDEYHKRHVDEIRVIYSDLANGQEAQVLMRKLLPFERTRFAADGSGKVEAFNEYEFYPSVESVLNNVIRSYISGCIFGALVDSFCSEQNARMSAMDSANTNAEELLSELGVEYNRVRQAAITQEITEVAAGAKAQRLKRLKEAARRESR